MKFVFNALIGAVVAGLMVGLCFLGIETLTEKPVSGPAAAATVSAAFTWAIIVMAKGGDE